MAKVYGMDGSILLVVFETIWKLLMSLTKSIISKEIEAHPVKNIKLIADKHQQSACV
jgi:hypothetical protein